MTSRAMHLIPRHQEEFDGLKRTAREPGKVVDGVEVIGRLSINSLGYAGHMLVKSIEELEALKEYPGGMTEILRHTGAKPVADITASAQL
jgi:ATP adenylyltransferase